MRIDPRHFNTFMIVVAIAAAIIIVWVTFSYRSSQREAFRQRVAESDSLTEIYFPRFFEGDSIRIRDYRGRFVLLDLWAGWSNPSTESHRQMALLRSEFPDTLAVIAASVRENSETVSAYRQRTGYPFEFVDGTGFYNRIDVPGIPTQFLFSPGGSVLGTFMGYTDSTRYDSLRMLIRNE